MEVMQKPAAAKTANNSNSSGGSSSGGGSNPSSKLNRSLNSSLKIKPTVDGVGSGRTNALIRKYSDKINRNMINIEPIAFLAKSPPQEPPQHRTSCPLPVTVCSSTTTIPVAELMVVDAKPLVKDIVIIKNDLSAAGGDEPINKESGSSNSGGFLLNGEDNDDIVDKGLIETELETAESDSRFLFKKSRMMASATGTAKKATNTNQAKAKENNKKQPLVIGIANGAAAVEQNISPDSFSSVSNSSHFSPSTDSSVSSSSSTSSSAHETAKAAAKTSNLVLSDKLHEALSSSRPAHKTPAKHDISIDEDSSATITSTMSSDHPHHQHRHRHTHRHHNHHHHYHIINNFEVGESTDDDPDCLAIPKQLVAEQQFEGIVEEREEEKSNLVRKENHSNNSNNNSTAIAASIKRGSQKSSSGSGGGVASSSTPNLAKLDLILSQSQHHHHRAHSPFNMNINSSLNDLNVVTAASDSNKGEMPSEDEILLLASTVAAAENSYAAAVAAVENNNGGVGVDGQMYDAADVVAAEMARRESCSSAMLNNTKIINNLKTNLSIINNNNVKKNTQRYKMLAEGDVQVCKLPYSRNVISKILNSKLLRRWKNHRLVLTETEIYSTTVNTMLL
jgi:hypothetical protein